MDKSTRSKDAVTQRILETTQETERLKQELQNLISAGITGAKNYNIPLARTNIPLESTNKVQIIKSFDSKHSHHVKKPGEEAAAASDPKMEDPVSPKKPKNYDVHQAREYIKRQRDKRKEEIMNKKTDSKLIAELRKEKLLELQQKASQLVKKNIEAKRQRSKSRDRIITQPSNESVIVGFNCAEKSKKHSKEPIVNPITNQKAGRDPNLLYPPEQSNILISNHVENVVNKKSFENPNVAAIAQNKHSKSLQNLLQPPNPHYMPLKESLDSKSHKSTENLSKETIYNRARNVVQANMNVMDTNNVIEPKKSHHSKSVSQKSSDSSTNQSMNRKKGLAQSHVSLRSEERPLSVVEPKDYPVQHKPLEKNLNIESPSKNKMMVLSNIILKKPGEEPLQENPQREKVLTPEWLKETLGEGDPYNFINTVKRQLKYVVNEKKPQCVDIGVQGDLRDIISEKKSKKSNKKSDLKSFISHKCMNLDPNMFQHINLDRRRQELDFKDGATFTNTFSRSDYDSDTSKNIPSISSESRTSLRRSSELVKQSFEVSDLKPLENAPPNLDTKKVDEIKLQKSVKLSEEIATEISSKHSLKVPSPEDIQRIKKKLFTESDSYSPDFIATDLSKSRDSLITFNCAKVSPNRIPLHLKAPPEKIMDPPRKSSSTKSETDVISEKYSGSFSEKPTSGSHRKSKSLTSASEGVSQKRGSRSGEFFSLYSELNPSRTDPELNTEIANVANMEFSGSSEVMTEVSEKSGGKLDETFTEVLKPKSLFTGFDNSKNASENEASEKTRSVSNMIRSEKSISNLYKSKSEQTIPFKQNSFFSKSESNIYGNKENIEVLSLKEPKLSLNVKEKSKKSVDLAAKQSLMKNISIRSGDRTIGDMDNTNEIHLKFEAEIHLLNDFNQSLRHFSEIEKAFESLRSKNDSELVTKKVLQNRDTQTSVVTKTSTKTVSRRSDLSTSQISTINYSRGSGIESEIHSGLEEDSEISKLGSERRESQRKSLEFSKNEKNGSETILELTQGSELNVLESVNFEDTDLGNMSESNASLIHLSQMDELSIGSGNLKNENHVLRNFAGMSLRMFDQLIKDEDARIENWKKIVKIREQALLDRTRGELVWLEMQKKQFVETGKLPEASTIKKKQRGILLKHQQEKHEMQRLKQMQKEASAKRKTLLKRERDLIKNQLLSNNMSIKLKSKSHSDRNERRLSGPLKVLQATGSVHSETSVSKGVGRVDQEIKSISSRTCSVVNITSAASDKFNSDLDPMEMALVPCKQISTETISSMKKRLLMREHALAKRRKTVEELLQWHKKLLDEEKAIEDLESKVEKIISKIPSESNEEASFRQTKELNLVSERSLSAPSMSQVALDRLLPPQENVSSISTKLSTEPSKNIPQSENLSEDSNKAVSSANYSTDFDVESVPEVPPQNTDDKSSVSSISQLIENFSRIEGNILNLSLIQKKQSLDGEEGELATEKSESSAAEEIVQDEAGSDGSSHSSQIPSEIEVKNHEEIQSEAIQTKGQHIASEENEKSTIIVEESGEHSTASSDENKAHSSVLVEEIVEEDIAKEENEDAIKSQVIISENNRTEKSDSDNAAKTLLSNLETCSREEKAESVSDNEELKIENVPDNSKSSLRTDLASISSVEQIINKLGDKKSESVSEIIEISDEDSSEEDSPKTRGPSEEIFIEIPETSHTKPSENEQDVFSLKTDRDESEDVPQSTQILDIVEKVVSEKSSSVPEESKPTTSQQDPAEHGDLLRTTQDNIPSASQVSSSYPKSGKISEQISSEEVQTSPSKEDASTSRQVEEIVDQAVSNEDVTSTSPQIEEPGTSSQVVSVSKEEIASTVEESERESHVSHVVPSTAENITSPSAAVEERQSSENKTDEEKVASLSIKASGSQREPVSENRSSSADVTRVETVEHSVSEAESTSGSAVSEDSHLGEVSEEGLTEAAILEKRSAGIDVEHENGVSSQSGSNEASSSTETLSAEEKFVEIASTRDNSLSTEDNLKLVATGIDESQLSSCRSAEVVNADSPSSNKIDSAEEAPSMASRGDDKTIPTADKEKSSTSSNVSTADSEKTSKSPKSLDSTEKSISATSKSTSALEKSPKLALDIKKRVLEILSETSPVSRGDKSPRMQDLCVMTYDLISPSLSPESGSPLEERCKSFSLGSEAEELLRKQLAIEQEIKLLTEQQQKEQAQPFYIREIPNKPPPPYTPPSKSKAAKTPSIIPSSKEQVEQITEYSAKIIHKAYLSNNLDNISISDNTLNLIAKNIDKGCYKFVFDLCKEVAIEHYSQFVEETGPSWLRLDKTQALTPLKPLDMKGLKKLMNKKLLELFGLEKQEKKKENAIMKWSRKKRDHVDEVLVQEMQAQETSWINFDKDELIVKDRITNEIMDMLLRETALVLKKTIQKKSDLQ